MTPRQAEVLEAVEAFILGRGYGPTIRQLGAALGLPNPSAVLKHLQSLERKGYISRAEGGLRVAALPGPADSRVRVPVAGLVPAGGPRESFDATGEAMDVPSWMVGRRRGNVFCIRVDGKSMIDAYIDDGDHVLLERTGLANSGDMVVAMLEDGSVTLKRLRRDNGRVFLVPENPAYQPIEAPSARILGRVIGVMRKY
ncbi:MAG TPA: transcriptional repressor LexA [Candidatus Aminicenantes bacterium]|nr:transcriptional repressor LexA [Candidatus Aminicenantes bacterium]